MPDGVAINGRGPFGTSLTFEGGRTYRLRIVNVGISSSLNFRIEGHKMMLVETEGSHTIQNLYDNLDVHVGQSYTVLVTMNQAPQDYYIVASTRFMTPTLSGVAILHYSNSNSKSTPRRPLPVGPTTEIDYSLSQARGMRWNLTANAARPNPQGSFHYGSINVTRTVLVYGSRTTINKKLRYAVNGLSYVQGSTPLKLADYFNLGGVFSYDFPRFPTGGQPFLATFALLTTYRGFLELVFQNDENIVESWHIDGYTAFVVG